MFTPGRTRRWTNLLGLSLGCITAVWLAGWVAAEPPGPAPNPPQPALPSCASPFPSGPPAGGLQLGQPGWQFGQPYFQPIASPADEELRLRYPLESVADRLSYEPAALKALKAKAPAAPLSKAASARLASLEATFSSKMPVERTKRLMRLHAEGVQQFVSAPGFGLGRMDGMPPLQRIATPPPTALKPEDVELPGGPSIPFASVRAPDDNEDGKPAAKAPRPPKRNRLLALHTNGFFDFFDPAGFGYIKDRDHVAGFEPHQFRHMPEMPPDDNSARMEKWAVVRLELVSLLKHDAPAVYVSDVLPNMSDAYRPDTRELTAFEEKSLKTLREGDDLATESSGDRIRMLGSLRATKQCVDCHQVDRGYLLGAFSWELQRQPDNGGK
jgi:hypothetical protein